VTSVLTAGVRDRGILTGDGAVVSLLWRELRRTGVFCGGWVRRRLLCRLFRSKSGFEGSDLSDLLSDDCQEKERVRKFRKRI